MDNPFSLGIRERYLRIVEQIEQATIHSGRNLGTVRLVVVTKSQPLEVVREVVFAGASILGENYAEEAVIKIMALPETRVEWHMIGHVQSRKSELVSKYFSMLHSIDSVKLANKLNRFCEEADRKLPVLLEINVSGEKSKFGFPGWDEGCRSNLLPVINEISRLPAISIRGLMTMPPINKNPEQNRPFFHRLRLLQEYLKEEVPQVGWKELSMGTSVDYKIAIDEGATYVRIGEAILGLRPG